MCRMNRPVVWALTLSAVFIVFSVIAFFYPAFLALLAGLSAALAIALHKMGRKWFLLAIFWAVAAVLLAFVSGWLSPP